MELQSLNDLGYPKRYIRTLQISEVVKSMKDLMNFTGDHKLGPIEGLKRLLEQTATAKLQIQRMQEMEQLGNSGAMNGSSQAQMALTSGTMNGLTGNNNNNSSNNQTVGRVPSRNNSFTAASNNNLHLSKDVSVTELSHGFSDDCFFNNSDIYGSL
ncbi:probable transcriptional regulator SLK1 isoform X2 [Brassica rapa]|nr:probable transcriptional regulator SLK1 isoform X2 [Brassica rapa]